MSFRSMRESAGEEERHPRGYFRRSHYTGGREGNFRRTHWVLYEERIFNRTTTLLYLALALAILILGGISGSAELFLMTGNALLFPFAMLMLIAVNFSMLSVRITTEGVFLRYGIMHYEVLWRDVVEIYLLKGGNNPFRGWGLVVEHCERGTRLIYSVPEMERAVLVMTTRPFNEVAFSTRHPEKVITALREALALAEAMRKYSSGGDAGCGDW